MGNIDWSQAANVVFSGLFIVFLALILLIVLVNLMGRVLKVQSLPKPASKPGPAAADAFVAVPQAHNIPAAAQNQTIAVISAAVAAYMDGSAPGTPYAITSVTPSVRQTAGRIKELRPIWGFAGMRQNTEPF